MRKKISEIDTCFALGTSRAGRAYDGREADLLFDTFLDSGGCVIDTAHVYADWMPIERSVSERCIGDYLQRSGRRDEIFLITKGGHPALTGKGYNGDDLHAPRLSREEMRKDLEGSLKKLRTDHIDLYFYHRDDPSIEAGELIETMETFVKEGKILAYGCSNWKTDRILKAQEYAQNHGYAGFEGNQALYNIGTLARDVQWDDTCVTVSQEMLSTHEAHPEILLMPYSSAANGFFHRLLKEGKEAVFKAPYYSPENLMIAEKLGELCAAKQCTLTQAMLGWFTVQNVRCLPLYATHQPERVKEALKTAEFHFEPEDFAFAQLKY